MFLTHQDAIDHHVKEMEKIKGGKITKFHIYFDPSAPVSELVKVLADLRDTETAFSSIDAMTLAQAKIAHYEEIFRKLRRLSQSKVSEWLSMTDSERNLKNEIFKLTDMGMHASRQYYIDYAKDKEEKRV